MKMFKLRLLKLRYNAGQTIYTNFCLQTGATVIQIRAVKTTVVDKYNLPV
jgi:hypothetical protein